MDILGWTGADVFSRSRCTSAVVTHLGASTSHGLDIDPILISRASALAFEAEISDCTFSCADFMASPRDFFSAASLSGEPETARFDTILLLSITKWLHLHHGDDGMRALFAALHAYLAHEGGTLVVEPQEYENCESPRSRRPKPSRSPAGGFADVKATNKNKALKPMFYTLKMRPPFEEELKAAGFSLVQTIEREEGGFSRPLLVWRADKSQAVTCC